MITFVIVEVETIFLNIFANKIPSEWIFNPDDNDYIWGAGTEKERVYDNVRHLLKNYGDDALGLKRDGKLYQKYKHL